MNANILPLAELRERMRLGLKPILVDVRTPGEFARVHAVDAVSVPLDKLRTVSVTAFRSADGHLYILCHSGARAITACRQLTAAGIKDVVVVEGGMEAWQLAGLPVVAERGAISLERQVRIAAGALVLLGCLLAWFVAPPFIGLSAFIGAGLVFSGITNICGMGILLGKMPWNARASVASAQSCSR